MWPETADGGQVTGDRMHRPRRARGPAKIPRIEIDFAALREPLVVSDLVGAPGRSDRMRMSISGVEVGDLTIDFVAEQRLHEGREIPRAVADEIVAAANRTLVVDKALDLLAVRARSGRDLRLRLRRAGAPDAEITWAIERLVRQGLLDDAAYARQVARARVLQGGVSKRRVVTELRKRGVSAEAATDAIEATLSEVDLDEEGAALNAAQKRMRALSSLEPAVQRQRLFAYLARRGFESDVVRRVIAAVMR